MRNRCLAGAWPWKSQGEPCASAVKLFACRESLGQPAAASQQLTLRTVNACTHRTPFTVRGRKRRVAAEGVPWRSCLAETGRAEPQQKATAHPLPTPLLPVCPPPEFPAPSFSPFTHWSHPPESHRGPYQQGANNNGVSRWDVGWAIIFKFQINQGYCLVCLI